VEAYALHDFLFILTSYITLQMGNPLRITLLLLIFLLSVLIILLPQIPILSQQLIFVAAILITGIPHGAMDHLIYFKSNTQIHSTTFSKIKSFIIKYIPPMVVYGIIWWIFPWFALMVFLMLSAYHFAETDLLPFQLSNNYFTVFLQLFYGIIIITNLLIPHPVEVLAVLSALPKSNYYIPLLADFFAKSSNLPIYLILGWMVFLILKLFNLKILSTKQKTLIIIQTIILPIILNKLPLFLGFALYFGLWHSVISLQSIYQHLYQDDKSIKKFIASAIPFTLVAFAGILILIVLGNYNGNLNQASMALFIGIAVLTLPHLSVMSELFQDSKKL
jgi:Brp/Blh family beta-carotene 15,15'-monooxygenase